MELHPPVSPSDDDIYQLGNLEGQATALPSKRASGGNVDTDVASAPAATGQAVPTVVSAPVVIGVVSSDEPATASSTIATAMGSGPASAGVEATVELRTAAANGSPASPPDAATTVTNASASAAPAACDGPGSAGRQAAAGTAPWSSPIAARAASLECLAGRARGGPLGPGRRDVLVERHDQEDRQFRFGAGWLPQRRARAAADLRRPGQYPSRQGHRRRECQHRGRARADGDGRRRW